MVHYTRAQGLTDYVDRGRRRSRARRAMSACASASRRAHARSQSAGLWTVRADPRGAARRRRASEIKRRFIRTPLAGAGADRTGRRRRDGLRERDLRRAIRPGRRAMVHDANCCAASPRHRRAPAAASTCTCWRRATSATGRTRNFPNGIVRYLDEIGLLSAAPDARALHLGAAGGARAARRARRHHLGQYFARTCICAPASRRCAEMIKRGCRVALGLDGATLDEDDDALREMRLAASPARRHRLPHRCRAASAILDAVLVNGRRSVTNRDEGGALARRRAGRHPAARLGGARRRPAAARSRSARPPVRALAPRATSRS